MNIESYAYFLLDLDGTLVDTEGLHYKAYILACKELGVPFDWDFKKFCFHAHGDSLGVAQELKLDNKSWDKLYKVKKEFYLKSLNSTELKFVPGAEAFLQWGKKKNKVMAIVTNSPREQLEKLTKFLPDLGLVTFSLTREDYSEPKPSPLGYIKAIQIFESQYGFNLQKKILGFEDTPKGIFSLNQAFTQLNLSSVSKALVINSVLLEESVQWNDLKF